MDRKKLLIGLGIAVLALVLVAGALATRGPADSDSAADTASGQAGDADGGSSAETTPGSTAAVPPASGEAPENRVVDQDSIVTAPTAAGEPASAGSELETVSVPPAETLALVSTAVGATGDTFRIAFRPYGLGPVRSDGRTLVVRIDSASRSNTNTSRLVLGNGTNAIVTASPDQLDAVERGGNYTGTLELVPSAGAFALRLTDASLAGQ